jgi:hypothetical protein
MSERDDQWAEFEKFGPEEIRKRLGAFQYGEVKANLAKEWLAHLEATSSADDRATTKSLAREANEIARASNDLAKASNSIAETANRVALSAVSEAARATAVARTNAYVAKIALAVAIISATFSIFIAFSQFKK